MTHFTRTLRRTYWSSAACLLATTILGSCAANNPRSNPRAPAEQADGDDDATAEETDPAPPGEPSTQDLSPSTDDQGADAGVACSATTESAFQIFATRCAGCHSGGNKNQGGFGGVLNAGVMVASGRVVPGQPQSSSVFRRVQSGDMPRGGTRLGSAELAVIEGWIECGAPEPAAPIPGDQSPVAPPDAGAGDAGAGDAGEDADLDDDRDEDADEDADELAEEAQEDLDDESEEAEEAAKDDD